MCTLSWQIASARVQVRSFEPQPEDERIDGRETNTCRVCTGTIFYPYDKSNGSPMTERLQCSIDRTSLGLSIPRTLTKPKIVRRGGELSKSAEYAPPPCACSRSTNKFACLQRTQLSILHGLALWCSSFPFACSLFCSIVLCLHKNKNVFPND